MYRVIIFSFLLLVGCTESDKTDEDLSKLEGLWGWNGCENLTRVVAQPDRQFVKFEYLYDGGGHSNYYVVGSDSNGLKLVMQRETRTDGKGNLVAWYAIFEGDDKFWWLGTPSKTGKKQGPMVRCEK